MSLLNKIFKILNPANACCGRNKAAPSEGLKKIAIVGQPNVGKSSIFNNLSASYATVSNYPGTTVELFETTAHIKNRKCRLVDTPGMYSFLPLSEEEKIARLILIKDKPDIV